MKNTKDAEHQQKFGRLKSEHLPPARSSEDENDDEDDSSEMSEVSASKLSNPRSQINDTPSQRISTDQD